ncbi:MAG: hypothetical protein CMJ83_21490, partial [Planctomycetes bacterium]|nr:hypothetical protein [Planctomycetota bacterium]
MVSRAASAADPPERRERVGARERADAGATDGALALGARGPARRGLNEDAGRGSAPVVIAVDA